MKIQDKLKELEYSINSIKDAMFAEIDRRAGKNGVYKISVTLP